MIDYVGQNCPVCQKTFAEKDDVVVCPDCGAPYHRDCWPKDGICLFAARHASGFVWEPEGGKQEAAASPSAACPTCGQENPAGSRFCNRCGHPLPAAEEPPETDPAAFAADPHAVVNGDARIGDFSAREWAAYIQKSVPFYLLSFRRMAVTGRKLGVSFAAFLLGPVYFVYRKAWRAAAVFTLISAVLAIPGLVEVLIAAGAVTNVNEGLLNAAAALASYGNLAQMLLRSLFGVYIYKWEAERRMHRVCSQVPAGGDRIAALSRAGGVSLGAAVGFAALVFLFYLLFSAGLVAVMGPAAVDNIQNYLNHLYAYMQ